MTVAYSAAVLLYYNVPVNPGVYDILIFCPILSLLGISVWFAIRYMDLGIKNLPELSVAHLALSGLFLYASIYLTNRTEDFFLNENLILPDGLIQGKIFAGLVVYALILMNFYFAKYKDQIDERNRKEEELTVLLNEAELNLLKSQLNPHFIFNSLNSISSLTITDPNRARNMVVKLSEFLRYTIGKGKEELVTLEEEINNVSLFLDIEKIRFGDRLKLDMEVEDEVKGFNVPIMILQPLIENAVKYSVYDSIEGASIDLSARKNENHVVVSISNPYDPKDIQDHGKGIGIANVKQRIKLVYGAAADLGIQKSKEKFSVRLVLPTI